MLSGQLIIENLACVRGGRLLFKDLAYTLYPGDAVLVRGPNGSGKSSLLRMIAGLLKPYVGTINSIGKIALADELHSLDPRLSLRRALEYWAKIDTRNAQDVSDAMAAVEIVQLGAVPVHMLSTGQKKRATLARVIAGDADIWLLDEPGNGLDQASSMLLDRAIAAHRARGGIIVAASHQPLGIDGAKAIMIGER